MNPNNFPQEFDDIFGTPFLSQLSRQNSATQKSKVTSEPAFDFDEDFTEINNLIHQRVNEPTSSLQPNPFFKDVSYVDPNIIPKPSLNPFGRSTPLFNDPQISDIIGDSPSKETRMPSNNQAFFQMGSAPMPEGWVNLLKSLERNPLQYQGQHYQPMGMNYDMRSHFSHGRNMYSNWEDRSTYGNSGSMTRGTSEVDSKENEDKSLEKNPYYKLKSKKEFEEERKRKEQEKKQEKPKPQPPEVKSVQKNIPKEKEAYNTNPINQKEENRAFKQTPAPEKVYNKNEEESRFYNQNRGDTQWKDMKNKGNTEVISNKKIPEPIKKVETPKNIVPETAEKSKERPQNNGNGKKMTVEREGSWQNKTEQNVKVEEVRKGRDREEKRGNENKTVKKEQKPEEIKPQKTEVLAPAKIEKEQPIKNKQEKGIEKEKKQEEVVKPVIEKPQQQIKQNKKHKEKEKPKQVVVVEEPAEEVQEVKEEEVEEPIQEETKQEEQEEFITLKKNKKKNKGKNENKDKNESKKQSLMGTVKKETEKLLQNQFSALQKSQQNALNVKGPNTPEPEDTKEENSFTETSITLEKKEPPQNEKKSKKKKKAEKKQAQATVENKEKAEEEKVVPVKVEEIKEEKSEKRIENKKEEIKQVPVINGSGDNQNKGKPQEKQNKGKEEKTVKTKQEQNKPVEKAPVQNKQQAPKTEEVLVKTDEKVAEEQSTDIKEQTKKKKKKKNKNKAQDKEGQEAGSQEMKNANPQEKEKKEDVQKDQELEGSTDEEDGTEKAKTEAQFSKSKKKKLKKRAKQQPLFTCINNAEKRMEELRGKVMYAAKMASVYTTKFIDKFNELAAINQEELNTQEECLSNDETEEEEGQVGKNMIRLEINFEDFNAMNRKRRKRRNPGSEMEILEQAAYLSSIFGGAKKENANVDSNVLDSKDDIDSVDETIGYLGHLIKNKTESQANIEKKKSIEADGMKLHQWLEALEFSRALGCSISVKKSITIRK